MQKGSPPRGRGKEAGCGPQKSHARITPAWAGKRRQPSGPCAAPRDHPRVGGEKAATFRAVCGPKGSPPRGRGKACGRAAPRAQKGDHPRVGGEKVCAGLGMRKTMGSPPRWRGKDEIDIVVQVPSGITPALAGKSAGRCPAHGCCGDHPRVGGEKGRRCGFLPALQGSPPRWRGKVRVALGRHLVTRITPALAGKRLKRSHRSGIFISGPIPFHSVLHRPAGSGGSRAGRDGSPAGQPQNAGPA